MSGEILNCIVLKVIPIIIVFSLSVFVAGQNSVTKEKLVIMDKETLAKRVETISEELGGIVRSDATTVEKIETPFLRNGAIYRVAHLGKYRPMGFTVGIAEPDFTVLLPLNPKGFMELKEKAQIELSDSADERLKYVISFLEATRSFSQKFQILHKFDDIDLIPKPSDEEMEGYEKLKGKYVKLIEPPHFADDSKVVVFAIKQQSLVKIEGAVASNGDIKTSEDVLEPKLPIPFTY